MRYYYIKNGKQAYNLREPLENILEDTTGYEQVTEEQWDALNPAPTEPSQAQLARLSKLNEIRSLKSNLSQTDYQAIKYAEGWISESDYASTKAQRQAWRNRINELEAELSQVQ